MDKVNISDPIDPFSPDAEPDGVVQESALARLRKYRISGYFRISIILGLILWVTDFLIVFLDWRSFAAVTLVCLIYTIVMSIAFVNSRSIYMKEMAAYAEEMHTLEDTLLKELDMPYALLDEGGHFLWMNPAFEQAVHRDKTYKRPISTLIPALTRDVFPMDEKMVKVPVEMVGNTYSAQMRMIKSSHLTGNSRMFGETLNGNVISLNLVDNTAVRLVR